MIVYRDMTFCSHYSTCLHQNTCHRPLTDEVKKEARFRGLPIAEFTEQPVCHEVPHSNQVMLNPCDMEA